MVDQYKGDCMQAAVASLFEADYDEVPRFVEYKEGFFEPLFNFITARNCKWKGMLHNPYPVKPEKEIYEKHHIKMLHKYKGIGGFFFASVHSPMFYASGGTHAVIIDARYNIVHDPNPANAGIKRYPKAVEMGFNGVIQVMLIEQAI